MITLADAKEHLRITDEHEDVLINRMVKAALDHMWSIDVDMASESIPPALRQAALMLVGHFYANREAAGEPMQLLPLGFDRLVAPYRSMCL